MERRTVELLLSDEEVTGVEAVSFVEHPAIEEHFIFLSNKEKTLLAADDEKRLVIGPALIPEKLIPRLDDDGDEYDVFFSKDTVRQAMELFMQEARNNSHTFEHQFPVAGLSVVESWVIEDPEKDKSAMYGFSLPIGTWMLSVKVNNDAVWDEVKAQRVRGFSIEGYFVDRLVEQPSEVKQELKSLLLQEMSVIGVANREPVFLKRADAQTYGEIDGKRVVTHLIEGQVYFSVAK